MCCMAFVEICVSGVDVSVLRPRGSEHQGAGRVREGKSPKLVLLGIVLLLLVCIFLLLGRGAEWH
jgi:hypothetical protein